MRYIKLSISLVIGVLGFIFYFLTVPHIDNENFMTINVESGDENVFDDFYINGNIENYSNFTYQNKQTEIQEELPILKRLDGSSSPQMQFLQEEHPKFISDINYDSDIAAYHFLNNEDYLISSFFKVSDTDYSANLEQLNLQLLNKETDEIETDKISRKEYLDDDYAQFLAMNQDFPNIKILFSVTNFNSKDYFETSTLILGEYNFETKNYTEEVLDKVQGNFSVENSQGYLSDNQENILIESRAENPANDSMTDSATGVNIILVNLVDKELIELNSDIKYIVSDDNELFSLSLEDNTVTLKKYDNKGKEVIEETPLAIDEHIDLSFGTSDLDQLVVTNIIEDQFFIIQSDISIDSNSIQPALFQVFDIKTGEEVSTGEINFNEDDLSTAPVYINEIGKN